MKLDGKVAVITGADTGIGRGISTCMAREGARIVVDYVGDKAPADELVAEIRQAGSDAVAVLADVSDPAQVNALIESAVSRFGAVDILVNNAGIETKIPFTDVPVELWQKIIAVNLTGPWLCTQAAARQMISRRNGGSIINISSVHEDLPMPTNAAYCVSKGGLRMLMRTVAVELAPHAIRVNNIGPGAIDTPMDAPLKANPVQMGELLSYIPLNRMGKPDEVGKLAVYLASDDSAYVTGSTYFIDGGMLRHAAGL